MQKILAQLNPSQKKAVQSIEGPILIIAGAGSGKTRALAHRIAYLIQEKKIHPKNILAVTFTNKAAQEMKERVLALLGNISGKIPTIGTFHSVCARILRQEIDKLGYKKSFSILDEQDQLSLLKSLLKELSLSPERFHPPGVAQSLSRAKNELVDAQKFSLQALGPYEEILAKIYLLYQKRLKDQSALDFDDLIMLTVKIFQEFPETLEKYQNLFQYLMIDEYQDTNYAQYVLSKLLAQKNRQICVVGDDWQGIYSWRGANIKNILDFEKDYPEAKVIKLEQNYRSTQNILDAAYGIISKNIQRKDKKIWTEKKGGQLISSYEARDEKDEADFVAQEIKKKLKEASEGKRREKLSLNDFVVLYRTNAQSRAIEESLLNQALPYRIIGGVKFYQRKEIKDAIAYLRLIKNFSDKISLERILGFSAKGVGKITFQKWFELAQLKNKSLIEIGTEIENFPNLNPVKAKEIKKFSALIILGQEISRKEKLSRLLKFILTESGYEKSLLDGTEEELARQENLKELLTVAQKYDSQSPGEGLEIFLEEVALAAETDNIGRDKEAVHLMTFHSAKGLEFKYVFIAGLEEGLMPHSRSLLKAEELEEERRLMYVGLTRAKEKAYLLFTRERNIFGSAQVNLPSRFLEDIPQHLLEILPGNFFPEIKINFKKREQIKSSFRDGERIVHEKFGTGIIISSQGDTLTVAFSQSGLKKLSASVAPIKKA